MSAQSTSEQRQRPLSARCSAVVRLRGIRRAIVLLAAFSLALALAPRAEAFVYWSGLIVDTGAIVRANLDGTGVEPNFISTGQEFPDGGVAVDAAYLYWADEGRATIGRANLDGTGVDESFLVATGAADVAVDAAHVYWAERNANAIGRANLDGTGVDKRFITPAKHPFGLAVDALRSFSFGKAKKNKKKGTAKLTVTVPGPGALKLRKTESVKGAKKRAEEKGKEKLPVRAKGEKKKTLQRKGKAKVKAEVTYTPTSRDPTIVANTDTKTVKLVKRG
jgi:hypothetical protein